MYWFGWIIVMIFEKDDIVMVFWEDVKVVNVEYEWMVRGSYFFRLFMNVVKLC